MKVNEANWERTLRVLLGLSVLTLGFSGIVGGGLGTFLSIVGFVPLITGLFGYCPAYEVFGFSTHPRRD